MHLPRMTVLAGIFTLAVATSFAQTTRVLFIGNSFTSSNDLPQLLRQVALSMGDTVQTAMITPGGWTFQQHSTYAATQAAFAEGDWDFVVLQEQSQLPSFPPSQVEEQVLPFATQLSQQVRDANACTEVVFLMTWGRENGDAQNCAAYPPLCTYEGMQHRLRDSYLLMAGQNASFCAPAGMAWAAQRQWDPALQLYASDGSHPAMNGSYLTAVTLYTTLFRRHCMSVATWRPDALSAQQAGAMQEIAALTVLDSLDTWNIGINDPNAVIVAQELEAGSFLFSSEGGPWPGNSWDFGDGSTADGTSVEHTFQTEGMHTVTLTVTDPCGRSAVEVLEIAVVASGIPGTDAATRPMVRTDGSTILVEGAVAGARFEVFDGSGRMMALTSIGGDGPVRIPLGKWSHGLIVWRMITPNGLALRGRIVVP